MDKKGLNMNISDSEIPIFFTGDQLLGQLLTRGCHNRAIANTTPRHGWSCHASPGRLSETNIDLLLVILISNNLQFRYIVEWIRHMTTSTIWWPLSYIFPRRAACARSYAPHEHPGSLVTSWVLRPCLLGKLIFYVSAGIKESSAVISCNAILVLTPQSGNAMPSGPIVLSSSRSILCLQAQTRLSPVLCPLSSVLAGVASN